MTPPIQSATAWDRGVVPDGGTAGDIGRKRHRILRELQRELERHPAVQHVTGRPGDKYRELRAVLNPGVLGVEAEDATLRVTWWPEPGDPEYAFHYRDDTGFDCGWHREPNPHVDGKLHYQERASPTAQYTYESISFATKMPVRILWTVLDRLPKRLKTGSEQ